MQLITKITKNGNKYTFCNETWETRSAWGHRSVLVKGLCTLGENKVRYYNRTWESYTYQACMRGLVSDLIEGEFKKYVETYKAEKGVKRLTSGKRAELRATWEKGEFASDLIDLREQL